MVKVGVVLGLASAVAAVGIATPAGAQEMGTVLREQKIASSAGGFRGPLDGGDHFAHALAAAGDVDGDGTVDLAVGAADDDDGGVNRGAVWILFLAPDGTVRVECKVSSLQGGFTGRLDNVDRFGSSLASLGDLGGDGTVELAVGAEGDDDGGVNRGAVWLLSVAPDGRVVANRKISQASGGFAGVLRDGDTFGRSVAALGDLDGDGVTELAVGASADRDGGTARGAVWVLFLDGQGTVKRHTKISSTSGGFAGPLDDEDRFGSAVAALGDLDGDGTGDLAVGADRDDDGSLNQGAAWILFLRPDGSVRGQAKISAASGLPLEFTDQFGTSAISPGDLDGDGVGDLAVGAILDDDGGANRGAVYVLFLERDGRLKGHQKISSLTGGFDGPLTGAGSTFFGTSLVALGDLDGDRKLEIGVGAEGDDTGGTDFGAMWVLFLESAPPPAVFVRNGLGVNPLILSAETAPVVGSVWEVMVDCRGFREGAVLHLAVDTPLDGRVEGRLGQRLIDWNRPRLLRLVARHHGVETRLLHAVPASPALVGRQFFSQAHVTGRSGAKLTNALDGTFQAGSTARSVVERRKGVPNFLR